MTKNERIINEFEYKFAEYASDDNADIDHIVIVEATYMKKFDYGYIRVHNIDLGKTETIPITGSIELYDEQFIYGCPVFNGIEKFVINALKFLHKQ